MLIETHRHTITYTETHTPRPTHLVSLISTKRQTYTNTHTHT